MTAVERAERLVLAWCAAYTRGLPDELAADRREELAADLADQVATEAGLGAAPVLTAARMLSRAARGALDDLLWRRAALAAALSPGVRWAGAGLLAVTVVIGLGLETLAVLTAQRVLASPIGPTAADPSGPPGVVVALLAGACGLVLLLRERTRWLAAIWLLATAQLEIWDTVRTLADTTTILSIVDAESPLWMLCRVALSAGLAVFLGAAAVWWAPRRAPRPARATDGAVR